MGHADMRRSQPLQRQGFGMDGRCAQAKQQRDPALQ
jgi:hypothetical protein